VKNGMALPQEHRTLAEILRQRGYRTAAFVSAYPVYRDFGLEQGFTEYGDEFIPPTAPAVAAHRDADRLQAAYERTADGTTAQAARWLERHGYYSARGAGASGSAPFFLWLHLFDPHAPYQPPPEHAALFAPRDPSASDLERSVAAYDGEIHFADAELGGLLDKLSRSGRLDETLVVVAGDHGEGLMQHGHMGHGLTLYEEQVRVPLIFRWPKGLPAGRSVEAPVQLLDLAPTILDLAGGAGERQFEGRSLKGALTGAEVPDPERRVFLQRRNYESRVVQGVPVSGAEHAVRIGRWKYIEAAEQGTYELYDLAADPQERHDRFRDRPDTARVLASILGDWRRGPGERVLKQALSPEQVERLRALGYVQ
jgi:arylsulfatase A-like enzyme